MLYITAMQKLLQRSTFNDFADAAKPKMVQNLLQVNNNTRNCHP